MTGSRRGRLWLDEVRWWWCNEQRALAPVKRWREMPLILGKFFFSFKAILFFFVYRFFSLLCARRSSFLFSFLFFLVIEGNQQEAYGLPWCYPLVLNDLQKVIFFYFFFLCTYLWGLGVFWGSMVKAVIYKFVLSLRRVRSRPSDLERNRCRSPVDLTGHTTL